MEAIADPPAYQRARAAVRFDDISRALVHALKYGDRLDLAPMMGRWLSAKPAASFWPRRMRWCRCRCTGGGTGRGASTSRPIPAAAVSKASGRADRRPRAQAREIPPPSRSGCRAPSALPISKAPSGSHADGKAEVVGRRLILVDDVLTSGATVERLRSTHCCGPVPGTVDVLVFARVAEAGRTSI